MNRNFIILSRKFYWLSKRSDFPEYIREYYDHYSWFYLFLATSNIPFTVG